MQVRGPVAALELNWSPLPVRPLLPAGVVHLVSCELDEERLRDAGQQALLSEAEAARAARFRFEEHRRRWIAGRALLKRLLALYANCEPSEIRLGVGEVGKPYLTTPGTTGIRFNYTDSGGRLIYALTRGVEVGVDLEVLPRTTNHAALAARKLSPVEFEAYSNLPGEHRAHAFLANWTRKEAYGKALGVGIRFPMHRVTLCDDYAKAFHEVTVDGSDHHLTQVAPPFSGIACVAVAGSARHRLEGFTLCAEGGGWQ